MIEPFFKRISYIFIFLLSIDNYLLAMQEAEAMCAIASLTLKDQSPEKTPVKIVEESDAWVCPTVKRVLINLIAKSKVKFSDYSESSRDIEFASDNQAISFENYFERIYKYLKVSSSCFVVAIIYLDRIIHRIPTISLNECNIYRLFFVAIWIAHKYYEDIYYNAKFGARLAGISIEELNSLELSFLYMIKFSLFVDSSIFKQYMEELRLNYEKKMLTASRDGASTSVAPPIASTSLS